MGGEVTREDVIGDINRMSRNKIKINDFIFNFNNGY